MTGSTASPSCTSSHVRQYSRLVGNHGCWRGTCADRHHLVDRRHVAERQHVIERRMAADLAAFDRDAGAGAGGTGDFGGNAKQISLRHVFEAAFRLSAQDRRVPQYQSMVGRQALRRAARAAYSPGLPVSKCPGSGGRCRRPAAGRWHELDLAAGMGRDPPREVGDGDLFQGADMIDAEMLALGAHHHARRRPGRRHSRSCGFPAPCPGSSKGSGRTGARRRRLASGAARIAAPRARSPCPGHRHCAGGRSARGRRYLRP